MNIITREFLENKVDETQYWKAATGGNIYKISDTIYQFTQHNFLSGGDVNELDGHYSFVVDISNFNYVIYKRADYGGLTWTKDIENKVFVDVHESIKAMVESIIAQKLLHSYCYDFKKVNNRGLFLIPETAEDPDCRCGKYHVVCTYVDDYPNEPLGNLEDIEKLAIETLKAKRI